MSEGVAEQPTEKPSIVRTVLVLGRTSNLPTVWTNVLAGWFLAGGSWDWQIAWLALAVSALYLGGMTLNDAFDVKWDREHAPERPVPSGAISERGVWLLGWGWMVVGVLLAWLVTDAGMGWIGGLVAAILLYDWIHKKWSGAMWVMGACRAFVYLVAGSAVVGGTFVYNSIRNESDFVFWRVLIFAILLACYVAAVTLVAKSERRVDGESPGKAKIFPWVLLGVPIAAVLAISIATVFAIGIGNLLEGIGVSVLRALALELLVGIFLAWWVFFLGRRRLRANIGSGVTTFLAGIVVVDALFLSLHDWRAALLCLAFLPVVRWFQMRIPAT